MNSAREYAQQTMIHYFSLCGVVTSEDNRAEINNIVDAIIEAAVEEAMQRLNQKEEPK